MEVTFTLNGWKTYQYWQEHDKKVTAKINKLIKDILRDPFAGIGKPEPLKYDFTGWWSRRIIHDHRLIYKATQDKIIIYSCRYHYDL
jgi:toxin YoeB